MQNDPHSQQLLSLRNKYAHLARTPAPPATASTPPPPYVFQTPIRMPKHIPVDKTNTPISKGEMAQKLKALDEQLQQKEQQLTQRMRENEKLLRESKDLRENESRKHSQAKIPTAQQPRNSSEQKEKAGGLTERTPNAGRTYESLRKNYEITKKTYERITDMSSDKQKGENGKTEGEGTRIKAQVEERMQKMLKESLGNKQNGKDAGYQSSREHKVGWVFENTSKIHERIQALLSGH